MRLPWPVSLALAVLASALVVGYGAGLRVSDSCACSVPDVSTSALFVGRSDGPGYRLVRVEVTERSSSNSARDAVERLLHHRVEDPETFNAFIWGSAEGRPITRLRSVHHRRGVIIVDVSRDVADPYPSVDYDGPPIGFLGMQQLVRTAQEALDTRDPVLLTVRGRPAGALWGYPLDGPEPRSADDGRDAPDRAGTATRK